MLQSLTALLSRVLVRCDVADRRARAHVRLQSAACAATVRHGLDALRVDPDGELFPWAGYEPKPASLKSVNNAGLVGEDATPVDHSPQR